jgi:glycerate kinase
MKIVIAPDKFKDCLSAAAVAQQISTGIRSVDESMQIDCCPMADGGEGTVDALVAATDGRIVTRHVTGPLAAMKVDAPIGILGDGQTAVIEMASASGLYHLEPEQRDPTRTTSFGTGELLRAACELGVKRVILGIGGSATVDGGIGVAQAWGVKFSLASGQVYSIGDRKLTGGDLIRLRSIEPAGRPASDFGELSRAAGRNKNQFLDTRGIEFIVACDVGNPLLGENGAAAIFAPQKGANAQQVAQLEQGLTELVRRTGRADLADPPGAGAAGGLGFGMMLFFGATLRPGIEIVIEATRLRARLKGADLCITGEGKLDAQSLAGKTTIGVAQVCKEMGIPCIAIAGSIGPGAEKSLDQGVIAYFSVCDGPIDLSEAIARAPELICATAANIIRLQLQEFEHA